MKKLLSSLLFGLLTASLLVTPALALEITGGEEFIIAEDKVFNDNLIIGGGIVEIRGQVNGDLIMGGGYVRVSGTVNGDVLVAGGNVSFRESSVVEGDLRVMAGMIEMEGTVKGKTALYGGQVRVSGNYADLVIDAGQLNLSGEVSGNADLRAGMLKIAEDTSITGNLTYASPNEVVLPEGLQVTGEMLKVDYYSEEALAAMEEAGATQNFVQQIRLGATFMSYLMLLLLGMIFLKLAPNCVKNVALTMRDHFWKSLGLGFLSLILAPIAMIILLFTVIGIPLSLIMLVLYIIMIYLVPLWPSYLLGSMILKYDRQKILPQYWSQVGAMALGLAVYKLLMLLPVVSGILYVLILFAGLGAFLLAKAAFMRDGVKKGLL